MIIVRNLSKRFGNHQAISDLSFEVPDGTITGFLGPNGSGKSTTFQCMLGLIHPDAGEAIFEGPGYSGKFADLPNKHRVAGALLDAQWVEGHRSGRNHLLSIARGAGIPDSRVDECLEFVGMTQAADKQIRQYSLGMKQRIHVAAALLGDPQHLIFDEPVNGLDPEGVSWMRHTMQHLAQQGRAVIVSSHLLSEMQITAQRLVVIGQGQLLGQYSMQEFLADTTTVTVTSPDITRLAQELQVQPPQQGDTLTIPVGTELDDAALCRRIGTVAAEHGIVLTQLRTERADLEEQFLKLTAGAQEYRSHYAHPQAGGAVTTPNQHSNGGAH